VNVADIKLTKISKEKVAAQREKISKFRRMDLNGKSLIDATLVEMDEDADFQDTLKRLKTMGAERMTLEEKKNRRRCLDELGVVGFKEFLPAPVARKAAEVLQLNIGIYCNQACSHCHVESSPRRKEMMDLATADKCLEILAASPEITTLDITGGAPEMQAHFRHIVSRARELRPDLDIIDRCNLTVVHEPGQEDLIAFLKQHKVHVIASLPCYSAKNVNQQRGSGVFERSISALLALNEAGYGVPSEDGKRGLVLDLVYNPLGAFLPPPQETLEAKYKEELFDEFGVTFTNLYTMTNMPVKRFADFLHRRGELQEYMDLLVRNFNIDTTESLMCRNTVSIGWDGKIYDCDFNQQLGVGVGGNTDEGGDSSSGKKTVFDIGKLDELRDESIAFDNHCYGCTAGMGSS
jgi:radical SAM/Cys-rich protein